MALIRANQAIYDAAALWRTRCLEGEGSLLAERPVWTSGLLGELQGRFRGTLLEGKEPFEQKLEVQLSDASSGATQLAAEILWLLLLFPSARAIGGHRKRELISQVWSGSGTELDLAHPLLGEPLQHGIGHPGQGYNRYRWKEFGFTIDLVLAWRALAARERHGPEKPWEFASWLDRVPDAEARNSRHMLVHLLYPRHFERIAVPADKRAIRDTFADLLAPGRPAGAASALTTLDRELFEIRGALEARHPGAELDFYQAPLEDQWRPPRVKAPRAPRGRNGGSAPPPPEAAPGRSARDGVEALAEGLLFPAEFIRDALTLLSERKQLILYGPPGTGKTYVAQALMKHLAPEPERHMVVQFHPSYSYEDFVQGYRPESRAGGQIGYVLKPGPLVRMAREAARNPGRDYVLLIDEINRGNLPKIFGELLYLLEYRKQEVTLMYGAEAEEKGKGAKPRAEGKLSLPENLLILGTMNTADRSIALVDAALRRRFHFVRLFPGEGPLDGFLERWLRANRPEMVAVAGWVDALNRELRDRLGMHLQVGHSYFTRKDLSEPVLRRVWEYDIMPLLEDQFFGRDRELAGLTLEAIRAAADADD